MDMNYTFFDCKLILTRADVWCRWFLAKPGLCMDLTAAVTLLDILVQLARHMTYQFVRIVEFLLRNLHFWVHAGIGDGHQRLAISIERSSTRLCSCSIYFLSYIKDYLPASKCRLFEYLLRNGREDVHIELDCLEHACTTDICTRSPVWAGSEYTNLVVVHWNSINSSIRCLITGILKPIITL